VHGYLYNPPNIVASDLLPRQLEYEINQSSKSYVHDFITHLVPGAVVPTTQPDCPKRISINVQCIAIAPGDTWLGGTFTIAGKDARGNALSEVVHFDNPGDLRLWSNGEEVMYDTLNAFDVVDTVTEAGAQTHPLNWQWEIGTLDGIGMIRKKMPYKVKRNNGTIELPPFPSYTIDTTYWTITPTVPWNASGEFLELHWTV